MHIPLLSTKLNIPPTRPDLVPRKRLLERLDLVPTKVLTLISAPAGFGKTTLLTTWIEESGLPTALLSLDGEDNDPTRFLVYITNALGTIASDVGGASLTMLQSTQNIPSEAVLITLINELSTIPYHFTLLLDDYHFIDEQEIHTALNYLIDHLPQRMHLIIASRSDPPLPLSRLRARGQLIEVRQADLRFTPEEAGIFLNQTVGLNLTAEQIGALEGKTEGWIAGLQLAALSLRGKEDIPTFIQAFSGSHRFVIDYLADEVLSQQSTDLRQFLHQTSILDRFTAPLCDAVTGRQDSSSLIKILDEANMFIIPLDEHREWYRYHHLFRDLLRAELEDENRETLHKKAARWLVSEGLSAEGVKHALASGDTEGAVNAISQAAHGEFNQASFNTLLGWLDSLPEETVRGDTLLATYKSFSLLLTQSYKDALPYAKAAEQSFSPGAPSSISGPLMSLKAHMALYGEKLDDCINLARESLEHLSEGDYLFRNLTLNVLGQVLEIKGDVTSAVDIYRQAINSGWQSGDRLGALVVFTNLVFSLNELGRRREALSWCEQLLSRIKNQHLQGFHLLDAVYLSWSLLSYEANQLDLAQEQVQRALKMMEAVNISQGITWGMYLLAQIYLAKGENDVMLRTIREGSQLASKMGMGSIHGAWIDSLEAKADLQRGDLVEATRWADASGYSSRDRPHHWQENTYFTYVRWLIALDRLDEAVELLNTMQATAQKGGRQRKLITIHILHALVQISRGESQLAQEHIECAVRFAAPEGYRRAFLDEDPVTLQLLLKARSTAPGFVDDLLTASESDAAPVPPPTEGFDLLTERELEVLRLVGKGLSNREIAEILVITLGTVKKHLNNIFSKLYVKSRTYFQQIICKEPHPCRIQGERAWSSRLSRNLPPSQTF
jgi:LuxR family maltose regulon positive regulatory protein